MRELGCNFTALDENIYVCKYLTIWLNDKTDIRLLG